ncbi:MAG: FAD-binding protein, partial [Chloroflexi bacterium]|nr:FAD-binding protein [Chloroflexota bacterium]
MLHLAEPLFGLNLLGRSIVVPDQSAFIPISDIVSQDRARGPVGAVMVVGGGIAGMQASLDLAEQGFKVYLVESKSAIGGHMA